MIARGTTELLPYVGADDIWRGYSGEDVIYDGIPRAGLVCWHDLYDSTASLASVPDLSGNGYALQLGSAAGADTNDPAWAAGGKGLVCTTDDYALTGNLSGVTITGPWTQVLVALPSGTASGKYVSAVGVGNTNFFAVRQLAPGTYELRCAAGGMVASSAAALTVPTTAPVVLAITCSAGVAQLSRLDTGASITGPDKSGATGATAVSIGSLFSASLIDALTVYAHLFYNRALSDAELKRVYRSLKATWAARGVTIS